MKIKVDKFNRKFVVRVENDGSGLLAYKGTILRMNEISIEMLSLIQNGYTPFEISLDMAKKYKADRKIIEDDIDYFLNQLVNIGLVENAEYMEYMNHESI